ncbi:MAG: hypothetical protein PQJ44_01350 [Sphaerochaetaceae bacterium]|nr:hypothetical protein [Sphaerochaetaceae bacterium]
MKKEDLLSVKELMPILSKEAASKNLIIYHFKNEELKDLDLQTKYKDIEALVLSKTKDGAIFNLRNLRYSYLVTKE